MRPRSPLDALFPRIRQSLLAAMLLAPDRWWYLHALAQHLRVTPSSLQRELASLVQAGILQRRRDGNRVYYQPDTACPFLPDLQGLFAKTAGLADVLAMALAPLEGIECAFLYGSVARGDYTSVSDVDLMVLGSARLAELTPALRTAERQLGRAINPTVYTLAEFTEKLAAGHHFLTTVMQGEKLFLKGNAHELVPAAGRTQGPAARHE